MHEQATLVPEAVMAMSDEELIAFARESGGGPKALRNVALVASVEDVAPIRRLVETLAQVSPNGDTIAEIAHRVEADGGIAAAGEIYDGALRFMPNDPVLLIESAKLAFRRNDLRAMKRLGVAAIRAAPGSVPVTCGFAEILRRAGRIRGSLALLAGTIGRYGPNPEYLAHLRYALAANRKSEPAPLPTATIDRILAPAASVPEVKEVRAAFDHETGTAAVPELPPGPVAPAPRPPKQTAPEDLVAVILARAELTSLEDVAASDITGLVAMADTPTELRALHRAAEGLRLVPVSIAILSRLVERGEATPGEVIALCRAMSAPDSGVEGWTIEEKIELLDLGVALHSDSATLWAERARAWFERSNLVAAEDDAARAFALDDRAKETIGLYADILWQVGRHDDARNLIERHLARAPDNWEIRLKAAQFAHWSGDGARAEAILRGLPDSSINEETTELLAAILVARRALGEAEAIVLRAMAAAPSDRLHRTHVSVATWLTWHAYPDYVDPMRVDRLAASVRAIEPTVLGAEFSWEVVRLFTALQRQTDALEFADRALAVFPAGSLREVQAYWVVVGELLRQTTVDPALRDDPEALARLLNEQGAAHQATGGRLQAILAFRIARMLAPTDRAVAFNCGFTSLAVQDVAAAARHFRGLERIYREDMERVAWPRIGQHPWPHRPFGLAEVFQARVPVDHPWPRISVITPSYGQGRYIEETILSILNQEYPNLEYIVVDGLSKDDTPNVLAKYAARIDHLVIEKDKGQTDAINKGLKLATGDLITWVNSDDMLAPGALFALAEIYIASQADIIFGFCLPYTDYRFSLSNLPAVRQETFTPMYLADIFKYWMKGYFFYQPEVIFSRRILNKIGGRLDDTLYFTMDYDFWMKCALERPRVEAIYWPIALFRHHDEQKTANLLDCMLEQVEVREKVVSVTPSVVRVSDVRDAILTALDRADPDVCVVTSRLGKIFSPDSRTDLRLSMAENRVRVDLVDSAAHAPPHIDLLIKLVHLQSDVEEIAAFRAVHPSVPVVGWFWDNHHHLFANYDVAEVLDVAIPGHAFAAAYLRNRHSVQLPGVPLCITQWSQREAERFYRRLGNRMPRTDVMYGGFVRYPFAEKRNALIERLLAAGEHGVYFLEENHLQRYFGKEQRERFGEWAQHKTSICLPLRGDLSQRLFDALLTGQVPIVAPDMPDLDRVLPAAVCEELSVVVFEDYTVEAVRDAHRRAVGLFDCGGTEAALARHRFALTHHTFPPRIADILKALKQFAHTS